MLLKNKARIKIQNSDENDFLHWAVLNGNRKLALRLLEQGVAVNTRDAPLTLKRIILGRDKELLERMLKKGLRLKGMKPGRDESLLALALKHCYRDIGLILLKAGAEPDEQSVRLAIHRGYADFVKEFINMKYPFETEHLNTALREKQHNIAVLLIDHGVEINVAQEDYAAPPLANSVQQDYYDIAELLISKGAKVNQLIKYYYDGSISCYTALDFAVSEPMRALLLKHGAIPATEHPDYEYVPYEGSLGAEEEQ